MLAVAVLGLLIGSDAQGSGQGSGPTGLDAPTDSPSGPGESEGSGLPPILTPAPIEPVTMPPAELITDPPSPAPTTAAPSVLPTTSEPTPTPPCECSDTSNCCDNAEGCYNGSCVASCPNPFVLDVRPVLDSMCVRYQTCNGVDIDRCIACDPAGGCFRCHHSRKLEFNRNSCVETCANGNADISIVLTPVIRIVCAAPDGETGRTDPPTRDTTRAPTFSEPTSTPSSRSPTAADETFGPTAGPGSSAPSGVPTAVPSTPAPSMQPTTPSPTEAPTTPSPTGVNPVTNGAASLDGEEDDTKWIAIGALAGVTGLCMLVVFMYICKERCSCKGCCKSRKAKSEESVEMGDMKKSKKPPRKRVLSLDGDDGGGAGAADTEIVVNPVMDDQYLTGPEATEFFAWLGNLKKHKPTFNILLKEMTNRRDAQTTVADREKYQKVVNDLNRILALFKQKKDNRQAPIDGMELLNWAQNTVDRFNAGG